jgi:hypothetical protein
MVGNTFLTILTAFPHDERDSIENALHRWASDSSLGQRILDNMRREHLLPEDSFKALLRAILEHHSEPIKVIRDAYVAECRRQALKGGEVLLSRLPEILGRAVNRDRFIDDLWTQHGGDVFGDDYISVERFVDRLKLPFCALSTKEANAKMSRHAAWVTWNDSNLAGDPFAFCRTNTAAEIRGCLGLVCDRIASNKELLLLCYKLEPGFKLYAATIADAEAHDYFSSPEPDLSGNRAPHSWTLPWPDEEVKSLGVALIRRPEALHEPQKISTLMVPVRHL